MKSKSRTWKRMYGPAKWILFGAVTALVVGTVGKGARAQSQDWSFEMVAYDSYDPALAIAPDGNPSVTYTYRDSSGDYVMFAHWDSTANDWDTLVVGEGRDGSLSYGTLSSGTPDPVFDEPMVVYVSGRSRVLTFARPESSASPVDLDANAWSPCLVCDPDTRHPSISYWVARKETQRGVLNLASWDGSGWVVEEVASGEVYRDQSLAYDGNGDPAIAYISNLADSDGYVLKYARSTPGLGWEITEIASYPDDSYIPLIGGVSLAFDPTTGHPSIAHAGRTDPYPGRARFAWFDGQQWNFEPYNDLGGGYCSLVYSADGTPFISYLGDQIALSLARRTESGWVNEIVDPEEFPYETAIALDPADGIPLIFYRKAYTYPSRVDLAKRNSLDFSQPPEVTITDPADGSIFDSGTAIWFTATATDAEDGDLTANLQWESSIDGPFDPLTGSGFSKILSDGVHTITASATDSNGKTGSDSVTITVGMPPSVHAASIDMAVIKTGKNCKAEATVLVQDNNEAAQEGATVVGDWYFNGSVIATDSSAVTDATGNAVITSPSKKASSGDTFTFVVTDIVLSGYVYAPGDNVETQDSIVVP